MGTVSSLRRRTSIDLFGCAHFPFLTFGHFFFFFFFFGCRFPFPMVQMTRTFLFFWVYSLPLVLVGVSDETDDRFYSIHDAIEVLLIMFFCTYGFLGLEYVCVELDDPYGDDPNDFCGQRWSELAFEDIYLTIYKVDGMKSASELKEKIAKRIARGDALELYQQNPIGMTESSRGEDLLTEDIMAELDIP